MERDLIISINLKGYQNESSPLYTKYDSAERIEIENESFKNVIKDIFKQISGEYSTYCREPVQIKKAKQGLSDFLETESKSSAADLRMRLYNSDKKPIVSRKTRSLFISFDERVGDYTNGPDSVNLRIERRDKLEIMIEKVSFAGYNGN